MGPLELMAFAQRNKALTSNGVPYSSLAVPGKLCINTLTGDLYKCAVAGTWIKQTGGGGGGGSGIVIQTDSASVTLSNDSTTVITGSPAEVAVTIPAPVSGEEYCTSVIFKAGSSFAFSETAPTGYTVNWNNTPVWTAGSVYEIIYRCLWIDGIIDATWREVAAS